MTSLRCIAACAVSWCVSTCAHAQPVATNPVPTGVRVRIMITNVLLGAVLGGTRAWIAQRPVGRGFAAGASGGLLTSAGRQLVATRGTAAGISGRLVHDVGLGLGSAAKDSLLTIPLHFGPMVVRWTPSTRRPPAIRVNLTNLIVSSAALIEATGHIDWRSTLWSGAVTVLPPVRGFGFNTDIRRRAGPGTVVLSVLSPFCGSRGTDRVCRQDLAHESIHVLQLDMLHEWVGTDLERAVLRRIPGGTVLGRYLELGAVGPSAGLLFDATRRYQHRWTEYEAFWLTEGSGPPSP